MWWRLLDIGENVAGGDEQCAGSMEFWFPAHSSQIGKRVTEYDRPFRRATGGVEPNAPQQAQPAICRCGGSGWLRQSFLHEGDLPCPACNPCGTWQA